MKNICKKHEHKLVYFHRKLARNLINHSGNVYLLHKKLIEFGRERLHGSFGSVNVLDKQSRGRYVNNRRSDENGAEGKGLAKKAWVGS